MIFVFNLKDNCLFFKKYKPVTSITVKTAGVIIILERKSPEILHDSEPMMSPAEHTIKANPTVVINLEPSLPRRMSTDEIAKGISKTPTAIMTAICDSFELKLNPYEHFSSLTLKIPEFPTIEARAKKMNTAPITPALIDNNP